MVQLLVERPEGGFQVAEVHDPAAVGARLSGHVHLDLEGVSVEPRELVARIHSVMRRQATAQADTSQAANVRFDAWTLQRLERQVVDPQGTVVPLSYAEYRLLCTLLEAPRRVFSREQLLEQARGRSMDSLDRSVDLLISRLRHKLGEDGPSLIKTVRGAGYMLDARQIQACVA